MYFEGGYTYSNFLMNMLGIFAFVVWFWLLVIIYGDLFRRHDISGWGKALWVIALVLTSYLGIFAYLITQGRGMAERSAQQQQQARDELRRVVGYSVADEITKLDQLKKSGSITDESSGVFAPNSSSDGLCAIGGAMSAIGTKRTSACALHMSAIDPKRTWHAFLLRYLF